MKIYNLRNHLNKCYVKINEWVNAVVPMAMSLWKYCNIYIFAALSESESDTLLMPKEQLGKTDIPRNNAVLSKC